MNGKVHSTVGLCIGLLTAVNVPNILSNNTVLDMPTNIVITSLAGIVGSLLPDIDLFGNNLGKTHKYITVLYLAYIFGDSNITYCGCSVLNIIAGFISKHRTYTHTIYGLTTYTLPLFLQGVDQITVAFTLGYLSHLILDSTTKNGINWI